MLEWYGFLSPDDIFFNRVAFTNINFFDFNCGSAVRVIRENVAAWYYTLRIFAISALLVVLLYIGIRMAISTVASDQAKYKKMITDWLVSFALVFLLHYIVILVLNVNNGLVEILKGIMENMPDHDNSIKSYENLASSLVGKSFIGGASVTWAATICYAILVGVTAAFLFSYIKRMLIVGFLIMIAPIITITYSIDRVNDGKAQALNSWLKEFLLNVLIQPFHCLIYLVFANATVSLIYKNGWSSISGMILAIMCMLFIWPAEKIVKEIFGFKQSSTMADTVASLAAIKTIGDVAKKAAGAAGKNGGKLSRNLNKVVQNNKTLNSIGQKFSNMPVVKQTKDFTQKASNWIEKNKNSNNVLSKTAATIADKTIKMADPAVGGAIAFTAMTAGANQENALTTGGQTYNTIKDIQAARAAGRAVPEEIQTGENNFRDALEQFARQSQYQNFKTDQNQYNNLKTEVENLLSKNTDTLERKVDLLLQRYISEKGYDLNNTNDINQLATDMDNFASQDLSTMARNTPEEIAAYNAAQAIQERNLAVRAQTLASTYSKYGISNTDDAVKEVLDRIQDDTFDEGPTP